MSKEPTTNSQGLSEECHAMISRISHEVRNPVAVIHSFHQLLLLAHPELSNDLYFQKIQENMAFLNSLLDELSCYNHSYRAVRAYVNPYLLLQNLCADTGVLLEKQQVSIELVKEWCCTIKVDIENSKGQYIEKDKQEATKDGSESTKIQHGI